MVASNRTHLSAFNAALAGADLAENYQNAFIFVHTQLKLAGFTVEFSSDGVTADATDNVAVIADVVSAAPGNPHTWVQYDPPAISGDWKLILDSNDAAAPARELEYFATSSSGYNADGTTSDRPTPITAAHEWSRINIDLIPTAVLQPMSLHVTRASDGEIVLGISINGTGFCETGIWFALPKDGDDPTNAYDYAWYAESDAAGAFVNTAIATAASWRTHHPDNNDVTSMDVETPALAMSSWASGQSNASGDVPVCPIDMITNSATLGRVVGRSEDHRMAPANVTQSIVEDGDTDVQRRVIWDDLWVVVQSSALPITF